MVNNINTKKGIIYYIISVAFMLLTFGNIFMAFIAVPLSVGFGLAAYFHCKAHPEVIFILTGILLYIVFGNPWQCVAILLFTLAMITFLRLTVNQNVKFTLSIAWTTLISAITVAAVFLIYLYVTQGNLNLGIVLDPIKSFGASIIDSSVNMLQYIYETAQLSEETIVQSIEQFEYFFEQIINSFISIIPGIYAVVVLIGVYVAHSIAKLLTRKIEPRPIPADGILTMRLSAFTGISYIIAYAVTIFATGSLLTVLMNYMTIIEIPLLVEGAISLYCLLTMKTESTAVRIIIAMVIGITIFSIFLNLSWIYVFFGAMDTYTDFRGKVKRFKQMKK